MMPGIRTTVTLDADVAADLRRIARERQTSFKKVLNDAVRAGLRTHSGAESAPYELPAYALGVRVDINLDKALSVAAEIDDAEVLRKIELRK